MTELRKTTRVTLHRTAQGQYRAQNSRGASVEIAANGGEGELELAEAMQAVLPTAAPEEHK